MVVSRWGPTVEGWHRWPSPARSTEKHMGRNLATSYNTEFLSHMQNTRAHRLPERVDELLPVWPCSRVCDEEIVDSEFHSLTHIQRKHLWSSIPHHHRKFNQTPFQAPAGELDRKFTVTRSPVSSGTSFRKRLQGPQSPNIVAFTEFYT